MSVVHYAESIHAVCGKYKAGDHVSSLNSKRVTCPDCLRLLNVPAALKGPAGECRYCKAPATCDITWFHGPPGKPGPVVVAYCGKCSIKDALAKRGMTAPVREGEDYTIAKRAGPPALKDEPDEDPQISAFRRASRDWIERLFPVLKEYRLGLLKCPPGTVAELLPGIEEIARQGSSQTPQKALKEAAMAVLSCRACGMPLLPENRTMSDGCPCNSPRGVNHGLVPKETCTCCLCDPTQTGSSRFGKASDGAKLAALRKRIEAKAEEYRELWGSRIEDSRNSDHHFEVCSLLRRLLED